METHQADQLTSDFEKLKHTSPDQLARDFEKVRRASLDQLTRDSGSLRGTSPRSAAAAQRPSAASGPGGASIRHPN